MKIGHIAISLIDVINISLLKRRRVGVMHLLCCCGLLLVRISLYFLSPPFFLAFLCFCFPPFLLLFLLLRVGAPPLAKTCNARGTADKGEQGVCLSLCVYVCVLVWCMCEKRGWCVWCV